MEKDSAAPDSPAAPAAAPVDSSVRLRSIGFLASAVGGFLITFGALSPLAKISPTFEQDVGTYGIDLWEGVAIAICGVAIVIGGFALRFQATYERRRMTSIGIIVLAILSLLIALSVAVRANERILELSANTADLVEQGMTESEAIKGILQGRDVEWRYGVILLGAGIVLALVGGLLSLKWSKRRAHAAVAEGRAFGAPKGTVAEARDSETADASTAGAPAPAVDETDEFGE